MAVDYGEPTCQSLMGTPLDRLVEEKIMDAIQPSALEVSLQAAKNIRQEHEQQQTHWQHRLERAHYETERAYRQYNAVEPENRLVARTLEKKWEETLSAETRLKQDYEKYLRDRPAVLSDREQQEIRALASDIPQRWHAQSTTWEQRQRIVRLLIERVIVTVQGETEKVHANIHWAGGYKSEATFNRPAAKLEQLSYYRELVERAGSLYHEGVPLTEIARTLNREGWQSAKQRGPFNAGMVRALLARKGLTSQKKTRTRQASREAYELTIRELSETTDIPEPTLYSWMRKGKLSARKDTTVSHNGIWLVKADANEIRRLLEYRERPMQWIHHNRVKKVD